MGQSFIWRRASRRADRCHGQPFSSHAFAGRWEERLQGHASGQLELRPRRNLGKKVAAGPQRPPAGEEQGELGVALRHTEDVRCIFFGPLGELLKFRLETTVRAIGTGPASGSMEPPRFRPPEEGCRYPVTHFTPFSGNRPRMPRWRKGRLPISITGNRNYLGPTICCQQNLVFVLIPARPRRDQDAA